MDDNQFEEAMENLSMGPEFAETWATERVAEKLEILGHMKRLSTKQAEDALRIQGLHFLILHQGVYGVYPQRSAEQVYNKALGALGRKVGQKMRKKMAMSDRLKIIALIITGLTLLAGIAYKFGRLETQIENINYRTTKMENFVEDTNQNAQNMKERLAKLEVLEDNNKNIRR